MINYIPNLLNGLFITIILTVASISIGFVLAVLLTICNFAENYLLKKISQVMILFFTGTPLLVQIFLIYYGIPQFEWIRNSPLWIILQSPMACAIIALSLNTACYTAVLLIGAIHSVPKNEVDACRAIGMSKSLAFRRIIFPRAFKIAVPAYSNEVIMILKGTSLASTITILDLMGVTQQMIAQTYEVVPLYLLAGFLYLLLNSIIIFAFHYIYRWSFVPSKAK